MGTLFGGTRTEIHDRKGRVSSGERPHGRDEISSCHRPKAHCRMVQGTVREVKEEHSPPNTTTKERQGNEVITVLSRWKTIKKVLFIMPYEWIFYFICAQKRIEQIKVNTEL